MEVQLTGLYFPGLLFLLFVQEEALQLLFSIACYPQLDSFIEDLCKRSYCFMCQFFQYSGLKIIQPSHKCSVVFVSVMNIRIED